MKLAQCIILDLLKDYDPVPILPETCDFHFSGVQLLDQDNPTDDPSILYIETTTQISSFDTEKLKDFCIICIGKKEDVSSYIENYQANLILIPENHSLASVVNTLYTGFHRILRWDAELQNAILSKQNYQSLFSIGGRFFGKNAMLMVNSSYNVIGTNLLEAPGHEKLDFILKNGYYSKDLTDGLAQMGYMAKGFQYKTPTILNPPNYMNCPIMVLSMHADNGIFLGFITIYFIESQPTATQFELFSHFAKMIRCYYLKNSEENASTPTPLESFMSDLINHTQEDEAFMQDRARTLRLPIEATYRLCVIKWDKFILPQADYVRNRLRSCLKFPLFRVVLYHDSILLLLQGNIPSLKVMEEINDSMGEFSEVLKICHGYAGFSTASFPLMKLNIAYQQALTAVRYGTMLNPDKGIYFYSHYYIYEMLDEYKKRYALEDMYIQKLKELKNPSEEHYDNLSLLRNYLLTERSISSTAKIMHMHRNSVIYRLGKIQEALGFDLNDPDVRLRVLISFKILELISGHIEPLPCIDGQQGSESFNFYE